MTELSSFWTSLRLKKREPLPKIAFADSTDPRILQAIQPLITEKLAHPILVGDPVAIQNALQKAGLPKIAPEFISNERYPEKIMLKQKKNNVTLDQVKTQLQDPLYQGIGLLLEGRVDGLIAGSTRPTSDVVRAALQCIGSGERHRFVAGHFFVESEHQRTSDKTPFLFADCAVMPEPSSRALATIAMSAADSYTFFTGKSARVALLSFSTRGSAAHALVDRIKEAVALIRKQAPALIVDGELQVDASVDPMVAKIKNVVDSDVAGQANVFIFPTLEAGNIGYKLVQRFANARVAGPLLWGLDKPMSDLSRGCTVQEVTDTALCVAGMIGGRT